MRRISRWVPSVRAILLAGVALVSVTLAAAVSVVSIGPSWHITVESEPAVAWIAVAIVLVTFAGMLLGTWLYGRWVRRWRAKQGAT